MLENFVTAFIVYFVVIDPIGNAPIFLAIPLLAGPAAITSVMVVSGGAAGSLKLSLPGLSALASVMAATVLILIATSLADSYLDKRVTPVFSRITAIIRASLSIRYIIDELTALGVIATTG